MSDLAHLQRLRALTQAIYAQAQQGFQLILAEEMQLRQEAARLNTHEIAARAQLAQDAGMKAIGADLLWQGWLGRSKTDLNLRLARVLARKAQHQSKVRQAYGKLCAIDTLVKDAKAARSKARNQAQLQAALDLDQLRRLGQ